MFAISNSQTEAGRPPSKEAILAMHEFNEELEKAGVLVDLGGLYLMSRSNASMKPLSAWCRRIVSA
ncbi:MAG TPA: hypothetical protein VIV58_38635, partial [Kofleriaceae bacterium]